MCSRPRRSCCASARAIARFGLYETAILGMMAQSTGWATAARECVEAAAPEPVISFGARHVHPDITDTLDYAAIVGGCVGASTPAGARLAGLPPPARCPTRWCSSSGTRCARPRHSTGHLGPDVPRIVLVDTFKDEAEEALRVAHALGDRLYGVRLDTPSERGRVTADLVREVRARLDQAGFEHVRIIVSGASTPSGSRYFKDRGRAGRLVRRGLLHQRRHAHRLHGRSQGDRRPAHRQARPHPGPHAQPRGCRRSTSRDGDRAHLSPVCVGCARPVAHVTCCQPAARIANGPKPVARRH